MKSFACVGSSVGRRCLIVAILFALAIPMTHGALAEEGNLATLASRDVSGNAAGSSGRSVISGTGRFVVFTSYSSGIVASDTNNVGDVFVFDHASGSVARVSLGDAGTQATRPSYGRAITPDGRFVVFQTEDPSLDSSSTFSGCGSYCYLIYVRDRDTDKDGIFDETDASKTELVSRPDGTTAFPNDASYLGQISDDGRFVAFSSYASNLIANDSNRTPSNYGSDAFVRDLQTHTNERVSVSSAGAQANSGVWDLSMSSGGRYVTFSSWAVTLVAGDENSEADVFLHDRDLHTTEIVSLGWRGEQGNGLSQKGAVSSDGRFVTFLSRATNLGPTRVLSGVWDIYLRDRQTGETTHVSKNLGVNVSRNGSPDISSDGRYVAYSHTCGLGDAACLPANQLWVSSLIVVWDRATGSTATISSSAGGKPSATFAQYPSISDSGQFVAFQIQDSELFDPGSSGTSNVYLYDRASCSSGEWSHGPVSGPVGDAKSTLEHFTGSKVLIPYCSESL